MKKTIAILVCLFSPIYFIACDCPEKPFPVETETEIDRMIQTYIKENDVPGVEVGIWIPKEGSYHKAFGSADISENKQRQSGDRFRIASITKTFTGLRILQLHDKKRLDIEDRISKYFPDFPKADTITIRNLLNMNSGITDFADGEFLREWFDDPEMDFSMEAAVEMSAKKAESFYPAGEKVVYSNVNYTLLGLIIENVTGNSVAKEFQTHIFNSLLMTSTSYPYNYSLPGRLRGYSLDEKTGVFMDKTELNPVVPNTGGAIISNLYDLKTFVRALYKGTLLSRETHLEQITTLPMSGGPEWIRYGLGIVDFGGFWGHNGTIFGFSSEMFYLPEKDAVLIINTNRGDVDDKSTSFDLFMQLTKHLFEDVVKW